MTESKEREFILKIGNKPAPRGWAWYISRARAMAEGSIKDVTDEARAAGLGCSVAVTDVTWYECVELPKWPDGGEIGHLRHLLSSLRHALPPPGSDWERVEFPVTTNDPRRVWHLDAFRGTGDDGEPVITVKVPSERYYWDENIPLAQRIRDSLAANERPDDEGIVACLLETPDHHAALRHAVQVDGVTVEHLAAALRCGRRLQTLISPTNPHRAVFRDMAENDSSC